MRSSYTILFTVSPEVTKVALGHIQGCEQCNPDDAQFPFNIVLDSVLMFSGVHTDYVMLELGKCPRCDSGINEETLLEWDGGIGTSSSAEIVFA
jgi:hypothetical protein